MPLSRAAIARPVTTVMFFMAMIFLGVIAFGRLPVDLLPDISFPTLSITTDYEGAGPQEVEREVTILIENALSTVPGVKEIRSTSNEGRSNVTLQFDWGRDLDAAANDVRPAVDRIRSALPDGADTPRITKFDPNTFPIVLLGIEGQGDLTTQRDIAENDFKPRLEQVEGVGQVDVRGARARRILVNLDRQRLEAFGLSDREVMSALQAESVAEPGGDVHVASQRRIVRTVGRFKSVSEISQTIITNRTGLPVRVSDVANVEDGLADATSLVRINGRPAILISITKQSGTNTVTVAQSVFGVVEQLNEQFPQARLITVADGSRFIRRSIGSVREAAMIGAVLTVIVLLIFLRNLSSTLIISTAIPTSILATFLMMFWGGLTLNLMTFGGLALAIGMLVDDAIVVLENIFRFREEGRPALVAADQATAQVGTAVVASTLTTIAVFLPLFFTTGIASVMFQPLAYIVTFSLLCSLLVSFTLTPTLCARWLRIGHGRGWLGHLADLGERGFLRVEDGYRIVLVAVMRRPYLVSAVAVILTIVGFTLFPRIGRETFPASDEHEFFVIVQQPRGTTLQVTDQWARRIERTLMDDVPGATTVLSTVGSTFIATGTHSANFRVTLDHTAPPTLQVISSLRQRLRVPGATIIYRPLSSLFFFRSPDPISVDIRGYDLEVGNAAARRLRGVLEGVPNVTDVQVSREESAEEFNVQVDPVKASALGVTARQVATS
ncbi:MAG: efflux RND transporter permease subunit, partial [Armatimonadota bacterium]